MDAMSYILQNVQVFILLFVRMLGIFILAPFFGTKHVPTVFKIGLGFFTSLIVFDVMPLVPISIDNVLTYFLLVISEFLVGLTIGLASMISFSAVYLAGQLIDYQLGFGLVNILDIHSEAQVPLMGNFIYIMTILIFMLMNGHYLLFTFLAKSTEIIPIGKVYFDLSGMSQVLTKMVSDMFAIGFRISAPIILTTVLTDLILGIISRTIPQLNVFMVGMPAKVFVGIFTLIIMLPMYLTIVDFIFNGMNADIFRLIKLMTR
ncbi:MAG: Flagellar biosynthetic protein fliR [Caldanaerobacter subterraneus]|jgi:flagellar biosynthetic protein FliR|uniref:Flagellar biosynthetic protein FliR n=3 Tax=Caldanaerobacter subterraneus TaxID=911092 RepID=A0A117KWG6_9THEO|nr:MULTISPECIES: flagellar biosynthetic protein FliR [Caldanaerobacter]KKC29625.1 flagellar biosynthesis protein FliR [Caldanaerobacter subterraneus subsp. pacificus DSM 12653]KUK09863.1 MAG: Flagellar biosynthetic protein fliR [Caldanaerobacter subterraneus]MDI3518112.1 flagellar biosynthesis protein FliR [Caldanaerobacter sp.]MDK2793542.1 flagellar biosynthesis protein FliR [Caldanaerobacter sp.]HBT49406.1 flagellar type III secretion system protein FliR [Caldanaerobacter subterraneus]